MKIYIFYFVLILVLNNCSNINFSNWNKKFRRERVIEYYDNGCKKHSISYFNNKFDGPMIRWDENCGIISETNYENGKIHGYWKEYYSNGTLMHSAEYFFGQKNGYEKWYYKNGVLKSEAIFEYGELVSDVLYWDDKGESLK